MKIKLKIVKLELNLVIQVLDQDLEHRNIDITDLSNGVRVLRVNTYPYFNMIKDNRPVIYLRSSNNRNRENDFYTTLMSFSSNIERDKYYDLIIESLELWSRD